MDHIDLEAATEKTATDNAVLGERDGGLHQVASPSLDEPRGLDTKQDVRLYKVARDIVEEVLQALPKLLQQQGRNPNGSFELLDVSSVEEPTVAGAKESNPQRHPQYRKNIAPDEISMTATDRFLRAGEPPLQPKQTVTESRSYKSGIDLMTREAIEAENERRKEIRQKWRGTENLEHIEDPWKELFRWPCTDEERKELQAELVDALSSAPMKRRDMFLADGLRAMACWISLIGLRLKELYELHGFPGPTGNADMPSYAVTQIRILIECIWMCNVDKATEIGAVLRSCYRRRVLPQPSFDNESNSRSSRLILRRQIRAVRTAVFLVNILHKHDVVRLAVSDELDKDWSMPIAKAEQRLRFERRMVEVDVGKSPFLNVGDLNLLDLQKFGKLQIRWTEHWDEHLELATTDSSNVLKLYWFSPSLSSNLCGGLSELDRAQRAYEIFRTRSLLLTSHGKRTGSEITQHYGSLKAPSWLRLLAHYKLKTWVDEEEPIKPEDAPHLSTFCVGADPTINEFCLEIEDHIDQRWPPDGQVELHEKVKLSNYPFYCERLRELRCYMDSQKPKGLRALWRDKRDSNTYYTFWLVSIFGALGVVLAIFSLAATIAQTWAQFAALQQSS
ncbi:MAG: hypothetical protein Q9186_007394 [Xanthomendoza sp. 1 TL-2023]